MIEMCPLVPGPNRIERRDLGHGFWQIDPHFGFGQTPNVPQEFPIGSTTAFCSPCRRRNSTASDLTLRLSICPVAKCCFDRTN